MYSPADVRSLTEGWKNFPRSDVSSIQSWHKSPLFPFCLPLPFYSLLLVYCLLTTEVTQQTWNLSDSKWWRVEGTVRVCVCEEADQHITLNKLMSQCQFAAEGLNSPKISVEVRLITFTAVEPWKPFFSSRESVDWRERGGKSRGS